MPNYTPTPMNSANVTNTRPAQREQVRGQRRKKKGRVKRYLGMKNNSYDITPDRKTYPGTA